MMIVELLSFIVARLWWQSASRCILSSRYRKFTCCNCLRPCCSSVCRQPRLHV